LLCHKVLCLFCTVTFTSELIAKRQSELSLKCAYLHTTFAYLSVNFACNFVQERSEDGKKISQLVTFSHTGGDHISLILPSTSLRPLAEIWYRVGCNRLPCFNHDRDNWRNSAHRVYNSVKNKSQL